MNVAAGGAGDVGSEWVGCSRKVEKMSAGRRAIPGAGWSPPSSRARARVLMGTSPATPMVNRKLQSAPVLNPVLTMFFQE